MSFAHVDSVDALKEFRTALWKYVEAANQSLSEADSDLQRTLHWLEHESRIHWQGQIRRRTLTLNLARESLRSKLSITRRDGSKPSAIEEQKAVALAKARLDYAEQKLEKVKQHAKGFQREALAYRGMMQRFVNTVQVDAPDAAAHLDGLIDSLEQYTALAEAGSTTSAPALEQSASSMRRPEPEQEPAEHAELQGTDSGRPMNQPNVPQEPPEALVQQDDGSPDSSEEG